MKIQQLVIGVLTTAVSFSAQAQSYYYESVAPNAPQYAQAGDVVYDAPIYYYESAAPSAPQYAQAGDVVYDAPIYYYESAAPSVPQYVQTDDALYADNSRFSETPNYRLTRDDERAYKERRVALSQSDDYHFRPYVGLDVIGSKVRFGDMDAPEIVGLNDRIEDIYYSFNLAAGMRFNRYFGSELFFQQSMEEKKAHGFDDFSVAVSTKFHAYGIDFIGYLPMTRELELLGALGFGEYSFDAKLRTSFQHVFEQFDTTAWRFGAGVQFNLNEHLGLRFMGRYVHMWDDYLLKNMMELSLGVRYMF